MNPNKPTNTKPKPQPSANAAAPSPETYSVIGYDKDADIHVTYLSDAPLTTAIIVRDILNKLCKEDCLLRTQSDGSRQPIDWIILEPDAVP